MTHAELVTLQGQLMGERSPTDPRLETEVVVRVTSETDPAGPVANSMVMVAVSRDGGARARYLSWIVGYADLDKASAAEPSRWRHVEPAAQYRHDVAWQPFGWGPLEKVWTHPAPFERVDTDGFKNGRRRLTAADVEPLGP